MTNIICAHLRGIHIHFEKFLHFFHFFSIIFLNERHFISLYDD
uniref:Uncharacterized protein n=1 Tax=Ascaris lumbricoides TaxID=6252 RepID=A0A0M3IRI9_ASCLU